MQWQENREIKSSAAETIANSEKSAISAQGKSTRSQGTLTSDSEESLCPNAKLAPLLADTEKVKLSQTEHRVDDGDRIEVQDERDEDGSDQEDDTGYIERSHQAAGGSKCASARRHVGLLRRWISRASGSRLLGRLVLCAWAPANSSDAPFSGESPYASPSSTAWGAPTKSLHEAASRGDLLALEQWFARGAHPDARSKTGHTALHCAARNGRAAAAHTLLSRASDDPRTQVDAEDALGATALALAADFGHEETVKVLLRHGANPESRDAQGRSPLWRAAAAGHARVVTALVSRGAEPCLCDSDGESPLEAAASAGHAAAVAALLTAGARRHATQMERALLAAANEGVVLKIARAAPQIVEGCEGAAALRGAAWDGRWGALRALLSSGTDPNARNGNGCAPLHWAARQRQPKCVAELLRGGADPNAQDMNGQTPLHLAALWESIESVEALIEAGSRVDAVDNTGMRPVDYTRNAKITRILEQRSTGQGSQPTGS